MAQGDPLSPTIFNMEVHAVVWHWILLVAGVAGGQDGWGREVRHHAALFYTYDGLVALMDLVWMKGAFDILNRLFYRVGLQKKFGKTVGMIFRRCQTAGTQSEAAYEQQMNGEGLTYQAR